VFDADHPVTGSIFHAAQQENGLTVRARKRFVATTDSDHDGPIFPNLAKGVAPTGPNQLWVADITYIAIAVGFVYLAAILDAWSRRVVGYAIGRRVDARLALAALRAAIESRQPPKDCIHHSDRGSQYAAEDYRAELEKHGLKGSMGRRGNPYVGCFVDRHTLDARPEPVLAARGVLSRDQSNPRRKLASRLESLRVDHRRQDGDRPGRAEARDLHPASRRAPAAPLATTPDDLTQWSIM